MYIIGYNIRDKARVLTQACKIETDFKKTSRKFRFPTMLRGEFFAQISSGAGLRAPCVQMLSWSGIPLPAFSGLVPENLAFATTAMQLVAVGAKEHHHVVDQLRHGSDGGYHIRHGCPLQSVFRHAVLTAGNNAAAFHPCQRAFAGIKFHRQRNEGEEGEHSITCDDDEQCCLDRQHAGDLSLRE